MSVTKTVGQLTVGIFVSIGMLVMVVQTTAQSDPTAEQATVDAIVQEYFNQTATAAPQLQQTLTLQAAFESAQTATAAFDATVQAAFNEAATATQRAIATPTPTPVPNRVVSTHRLDLAAGFTNRMAYLSPDGERIAHVTPDAVCIYTVEGVEERCISIEEKLRSVDNERVSWSPDSRYLALTENFFLFLNESDLWIIDADTGNLLNLTDDGVEGSALRSSDVEGAYQDVAPTWLPDGRIAFLRYQRSGENTRAVIYTIQPDSRDLQLLTTLSETDGLSSYGYALSQEGRYLAYNWQSRGDSKAGGLWLRDLETNEERLLVRAEESIKIPLTIAFSPDSNYVMWMDASLASYGVTADPANSGMHVMALEGGAPALINEEQLVYAAWWSPSGSALAYLVYDRQNEAASGLYVATAPGEAGEKVLDGLLLPPTSRTYVPVMWAANDVILLSNAPEEGVTVVQLGN